MFAVQLANINSVEEAGYRDLTWLISNLPKARDVRPESAEFMEKAIGAKTVTISITPRKSASDDASAATKLHIDVTPSITKQGGTKTIQPMVGQKVDVVTTLGALATPGTLSLGETVYIAANEWSSGLFGDTHYLGGSCTLPLPAKEASSGTVSGGDGSYDVTVSIS